MERWTWEGDNIPIIRGANNTEVCTVDNTWDDWQDNARLIVKAVNSYDALIEVKNAASKLIMHRNAEDLHPIDYQRLEPALNKVKEVQA
jgi:hypothetical protein